MFLSLQIRLGLRLGTDDRMVIFVNEATQDLLRVDPLYGSALVSLRDTVENITEVL